MSETNTAPGAELIAERYRVELALGTGGMATDSGDALPTLVE